MTENQTKWVEALRSGKYKQGRQYLNQDGKYCCLGVACEVLKIMPEDMFYPPWSLVQALDLVDDAGKSRDSSATLAWLNDNGKDFEAIADLIETGNYFATVPLLPEGSKGLD